jgi:CheY-like chemotaxis protein
MRVLIVHWNAVEAEERAALVRRAGYVATWFAAPDQGRELRTIRSDAPDAVVIDLARLPSQGRDVAIWLRQQKATRHVPILFIEGDREKTARVRALIPDATYTTWRSIRAALERALARRSAGESGAATAPVVPGTMAGYSGTPLPKKLGIKEGDVVCLLDAPAGFERALGALPAGAITRRDARAKGGVVLLFVRSLAAMRRRFPAADRALAPRGRLWIVWPKRTSALAGDVAETHVRALGLESGFVDYKICAVDETWSGLCFARRG